MTVARHTIKSKAKAGSAFGREYFYFSGIVGLLLALLVSPAEAQEVVDVDAGIHCDPTAGFTPATFPVDAGTYELALVNPSLDSRAQFTAWSFSFGDAGTWRTGAVIALEDNTTFGIGNNTSDDTAEEAFANATNTPILVSVPSAQTLRAWVGDNVCFDNQGGVSFLLSPVLLLEKELVDAPELIEAGSILTFAVTARNNIMGTTLENVVVSDALLTPDSATCPSLVPGADCTLTGTYEVTQADVDGGSIVNTASAGSDELATPLETTLTTPIAQNASLDVSKILSDVNGPITAGSELTYTITATNTGNVTLTDVMVTDDLVEPSVVTCPSVAPGGECLLAGSYTVSEADVQAGEVVNTAGATAQDPDGAVVPLVEDSLVTTVDAAGTAAPTAIPALGSFGLLVLALLLGGLPACPRIAGSLRRPR